MVIDMKLCVLISIVFMFQSAFAFNFKQDAKAYKRKIESRPEAALSEQTFKLMNRAQEDLNQGAKDRAFKLFDRLIERTKGSPVENAQVLQNLGFAYAQEDKNDKALETFLKVLDYDVLPKTPTLMSMYIIGQIYALKGKHEKSIDVLSFWLKVAPNPSGTAYAMLAASQYELGRKKEALVSIQKAIDLTSRPKESWLSMAVSLYFANEKYLEAARVLKILVAENPKKETYWRQWASSHLSADEEKEALVAMELGEIQGATKKDSDIKNAASLMMTTEIPYKAAMWMEKKLSKKERNSLKNQKLLASAYMSARENKKALDVLRRIHKNQPDLSSSIQLAQILQEEEKWEESIEVFKKARTLKPTKDQKEQIFVGLGVAHFNLGDTESSREAFIKVADSSEAAQTWLSFIQKQNVSL
jgi:tetratricopeptide (TPR) repeat protein